MNGFEAGVDVEVPAVGAIRQVRQPADPPRAHRAAPRHVDEQLARQPLGQLAQLAVGGAHQVGQQGQRLVGVVAHALVDGRLVELAHLR
jgi:hypothetical protein